jgi:hypothetical protein
MAYRAELTNAVHPMVSVDKFSKEVDYETVFLQPALLVTRLLGTPQAVHYFLALILDAPHQSELKTHPTSTGVHRYQEIENIHALRPSDYVLVDRTLRRVARTMTWSLRKMPEYGESCPLPRKSSDQSMFSARSKININALFRQISSQLGDRKKLRLQFLLAVTMIHELAHATLHALTEMPRELFFGKCGSGEAGWELEARLFGLCISEQNIFSGEFSWYKLGVGEDKHLQPVPLARVRTGFIEKLFTDEFLDRQFILQGAWSIIPPAAWPPVVFVPDSIDALIRTAMARGQRNPISEVEASSRKRKRSGDDDDDLEK